MPRHKRLHRMYNLAAGLILLTMVAPTLVLIAIALFVTQGPRIIYAGERLGQGRKVFKLYKFRTLDSEKARTITARQVLPEDSGLETPLGKYLRASRLDELPQLFNVIKGDMNLNGPRPVRPEIDTIYSKVIENYDIRYDVKPGLVGHAQAWFSHGSSKRIRAKLNYIHCRAPVSYLQEYLVLAVVGVQIVRVAVANLISLALPIAPDKVARARARHLNGTAMIGEHSVPILALDRSNIEFAAEAEIGAPPELLMVFVCTFPNHRILRIKLRCSLKSQREGVLRYSFTPGSELSHHLLHRYVLGTAVVRPKGVFSNGVVSRVRNQLIESKKKKRLFALSVPAERF